MQKLYMLCEMSFQTFYMTLPMNVKNELGSWLPSGGLRYYGIERRSREVTPNTLPTQIPTLWSSIA